MLRWGEVGGWIMMIKEKPTKYNYKWKYIQIQVHRLLNNICGYEIYSDSTSTDDDMRVQRCEARMCASFSASLHWAITFIAFNVRFPSRQLEYIWIYLKLLFMFYILTLPDCSKAFHQISNIKWGVFLSWKFPTIYCNATAVIFNLIISNISVWWLISVAYIPCTQLYKYPVIGWQYFQQCRPYWE